MTVADNVLVEVDNLVGHTVGYKIEEDNVRRVFQPYEKKKLTAGELRKLNYRYGGNVLLTNYLSVKNQELAAEFGVSSDTIEYNWTKDDVDRVLTTEPIEVLLDALDFGPDGIKNMIVDRAVELEINNMDKRNAILEKTGFDVTNMINFKKMASEGEDEEKPSNTQRRVKKSSSTSGRRVEKTKE